MAIRTQWHFVDNSARRSHRLERRYGAFRRSMTLPVHVFVEAIEASTDSAVLQIVAPRRTRPSPEAHRDDSVGRSCWQAEARDDREEERMKWPRW